MTHSPELPLATNGHVEQNGSLARILDPSYDAEHGAMDVEPSANDADSENDVDTVASEGFCIECEGVQIIPFFPTLLPDGGQTNPPDFHVHNAAMSSVRFAFTRHTARVPERRTRARHCLLPKGRENPRESLMVQGTLMGQVVRLRASTSTPLTVPVDGGGCVGRG